LFELTIHSSLVSKFSDRNVTYTCADDGTIVSTLASNVSSGYVVQKSAGIFEKDARALSWANGDGALDISYPSQEVCPVGFGHLDTSNSKTFKTWSARLCHDVSSHVQNRWCDTVWPKIALVSSRLASGAILCHPETHSKIELRKPVYDFFESLTGRPRVTEGTNYLVLPKVARACMQSRYKNGKIVTFDVSALETRILAARVGLKICDDPYDSINAHANLRMTRDEAKTAVLSTLFGASAEVAHVKIDAMTRIRNAFDISSFSISNGKLTNGYGRKLKCFEQRLLASYYAQSTGVDASWSAFDRLVKCLDETGIEFVPICAIHDALIIDIANFDEFVIKNACDRASYDDVLACDIPLKFSALKFKMKILRV
jgi:hypothetical protein